jgi:hypothetical protein
VNRDKSTKRWFNHRCTISPRPFRGRAEAASIRKTPRCLASLQILGSRGLQPLKAAHLPPLQLNNMSRAGGTLLGLSQWEGDKGGSSFGGARRKNAAA